MADANQSVVNITFTPVQSDRMLAGRNIVVTGGASGIGFAMARKFISVGAQVLIADINVESIRKACEALGNSCKGIAFDVCDIEGMDRFLAQAEEKFSGPVTTLCSNAGISLHEHGIMEVTPEKFEKQFHINLRAPFFLVQSFLKRYEHTEGRKDILITTSEAGDEGFDRPYGMSKAALDSFITAISHRCYEHGIRINGIAPGVTITNMTRTNISSTEDNLAYEGVAGRVFRPEEIAEVACFLVSDAALCISGEIIHCNAAAHVRSYYKA